MERGDDKTDFPLLPLHPRNIRCRRTGPDRSRVRDLRAECSCRDETLATVSRILGCGHMFTPCDGSESGSKDSDAGRFSSMSVSNGFLHMLVHVGSGEGEQHAEYNRKREHCRRGDSRMFPSQRPAGEKQTDQGRPHGMNVVAE